MRRLVPFAALIAAILVPAAVAAPKATQTLRGTVVAKDSEHHGLVIALPGGSVQTFVAPSMFERTDVGRTLVVRFATVAGTLPVAVSVRLTGHASRAVVRGTIVRIVKHYAIINAGSNALRVTLRAPKGKRVLALANGSPQVGDSVTADVAIADNGTLDATSVVVAPTPTVPQAGPDGEMEVRGTVKSNLPPTIVVTTGSGVDVPCTIPDGVTLNVKTGDLIELKCDLIGTVWTVRVAHGESDQGDGDNSQGGSIVSNETSAGPSSGDDGFGDSNGSGESDNGNQGGSTGPGSNGDTGTFGGGHESP